MSEANHGKGWTPDLSAMVSNQSYIKKTEPFPVEVWRKAIRASMLEFGIDPDDLEQARNFYHESGLAEVVEYDTGMPNIHESEWRAIADSFALPFSMMEVELPMRPPVRPLSGHTQGIYPLRGNLRCAMTPSEGDREPLVPLMIDIPTKPPEVLKVVITPDGPVALRIQYRDPLAILARLRK